MIIFINSEILASKGFFSGEGDIDIFLIGIEIFFSKINFYFFYTTPRKTPLRRGHCGQVNLILKN